MSSQILMKKEIISRLGVLSLQSDKLNFLKWQKDNLLRSDLVKQDSLYRNRLQWIETQINIVRHTRENDTDNEDNLTNFFE
jgi:hypothetical protein